MASKNLQASRATISFSGSFGGKSWYTNAIYSFSGHVVTGAPSFPFPVRPENRISVSGAAGKPEFGSAVLAPLGENTWLFPFPVLIGTGFRHS